MVQVYFPNMFMRLINYNLSQGRALLRVPPRMTKTEVKEYLRKIYDVPVQKVMTENVLGKWKRIYGKRKVITYKRRNYKNAYVKFDPEPVNK